MQTIPTAIAVLTAGKSLKLKLTNPEAVHCFQLVIFGSELAHVTVDDVYFNGTSCFAQKGAIPAKTFAANPNDWIVVGGKEPWPAGSSLEIELTNYGATPSGLSLLMRTLAPGEPIPISAESFTRQGLIDRLAPLADRLPRGPVLDIKGQGTFVLECPEIAHPTQILVARQVLPEGVHAFRPTSFVFDDPEHWVISAFTIGNRSQLKAHQGVIATAFDTYLVDMAERSTVQAQMEFAMTAIAQRAGLRFRCALTGAWA